MLAQPCPGSPRTPNGKTLKMNEDTVVSVFGADGSRFIEELMCTDPDIVEGIARSGSLSSLLGSVYSPLKPPTLNALHSPRPSSHSPWRTPEHSKGYNSFRFPVSPSMEAGLIRRSARLTPTSWISESEDEAGSQSVKRRRPEEVAFRKALRMDPSRGRATASMEKREFEALVMGPISPMTPYLGSEPPGGKAKIFSSEKRRPSISKRGEYKCGKCGFYPKKLKHDCNEQRQILSRQGSSPDGGSPSKMPMMGVSDGSPPATSLSTIVSQNLAHRLHPMLSVGPSAGSSSSSVCATIPASSVPTPLSSNDWNSPTSGL
eukprot:m.226239 g.226239  ORF g.226239 m.226239 type:complete len:318 (-) comp33487_c0_seq7:3137-4090(-)